MTRTKPDDRGEVVLYRTEDGKSALDVRLAGETAWLTQAQIADLFAVNVPAISKHVKNINEEGRGVLRIISRYAKSWLLLKQYDEKRLAVPERRKPARIALDSIHARPAIDALKTHLMERGEATTLFGQERNEHLTGILGSIEQTFDGQPLYPSIEEKAAHLLYFVIKGHPFADGNKRIGSFLFILFPRENAYLEDAAGQAKINDNALVALALLSPKANRATGTDDSARHEPAGRGFDVNSADYNQQTNDRELVVDILKHGAEAEVLRPKSLRDWVLAQHVRAASKYRK